MFDLIEEDLSTGKIAPKPELPKPFEPTVFAMPEKFRKRPKTELGMPLLVGGGVVFFLIIGAAVLFLLLPKPRAEQAAELAITQQPIAGQVVSTTTEAESASSTVSTLEMPPLEQPATSTEEMSSTTPIEPIASSTPIVEQPLEPLAVPGLDSDTDLLSDAEERLYGTDSTKPDTDGDGFSDGSELVSGYDPTKPGGVRLEGSSLVNEYTNKDYKFKFLYPASWTATAVNQLNREVLITSATGEFMSVTVEDNPKKISAFEWATTVAENPESKLFREDNQPGFLSAISEDGLVVYITRKDETSDSVAEPYVYVLKYNLNTKSEINFATSFSMILKNFGFIDTETVDDTSKQKK